MRSSGGSSRRCCPYTGGRFHKKGKKIVVMAAIVMWVNLLRGVVLTVVLGLLGVVVASAHAGGAEDGGDRIDTAFLQECIVTLQPVYDGTCEQYIAELRKELGRRGFRTASDLLEDYVEGGFLSGVVVLWGSQKYVLTSRHGLALAQGAEVELGGGEERIGRCEIVYSQGPTDLAVVALPDSYRGAGLPLDTMGVGKESELLVAGYAGFGGEPRWTLERNHRMLRMKAQGEGGAKKEKRLIEHDATLDPGMSGSALLIRDLGRESGVSLLGVNIWKATLYEGRSVAVPVNEVIDVLRQLDDTPGGTFDGAQFAAALNEDGESVESWLSDGYVVSVPVSRVFGEYDCLDRGVRKRVAHLFNVGEGVEGVRVVLASALRRGYADAYTRVVTNGELHEVVRSEEREPLVVTHERGAWQVEELALPPLPEQRHYGLAHSVEMRGTARAGVKVPFYGKEGVGLALQFSYMQWTYVFFRIDGVYGRYGFEATDPMTDLTSEVRGHYVGLAPSLGVQLPVKLNAVLLLPYVRGFYGMHYSLQTKQEAFSYFRTYRAVPGVGVGMDVAYRLRDGLYVVGGVGGQYVVISSNFGGRPTKGVGLELSVGIGF